MDAPSSFPIVAIDGPAASGKSSVARAVARHFGFCFVSSGLLYRAVAAVSLRMDAETPSALAPLLPEIGSQWQEAQMAPTWRERILPEEELTASQVNSRVSSVAAWPEVRAWALEQFRTFAQQTPLVMEGRDIGSVVFPETPFKIYLDASPEVREARRRAQGITDAIARRDHEDSTRALAPLAIPHGAFCLDNSHLTPAETLSAVLAALDQQGLRP